MEKNYHYPLAVKVFFYVGIAGLLILAYKILTDPLISNFSRL